jgi:hypothetical protein
VGGSKAKRRSRTQKRFRSHALGIDPFCRWCRCPLDSASATTDHLIPLSRGGTNDWENLCLACYPCNNGRQSRLPGEFLPEPKERPEPEERPARQEVGMIWTRYPGGRWRPTVRSDTPKRRLKTTMSWFGKSVEKVVLPPGQEPEES